MADVTIRSREDGVVELAPKHAPADASDRLVVIGAVLFAASGLFLSGLMPAGVLAAIAASCRRAAAERASASPFVPRCAAC
jgi:hypothetical protein